MLKKNELADSNSCLNKADPLEPLFVLRAKDPLAPQTIRHWVTMSNGHHAPEKLREALDCAEKMEAFRKRQYPPDPPQPAADEPA